MLILQCSSSSSSSPQLSTHWICPVGSPPHQLCDDKPKANFRVCCSHSPRFGFDSFPTSKSLSLGRHEEMVQGTVTILWERKPSFFSSHSCQQQDSEVASKVKRSLNHRCCRRAGIAHFNQAVKSHYWGCSISFIPWLLMFSWLCGTLSSKDKHQGFYNYQLIISAKVGEVDSQQDNKGVISIQGGYKGYWEDNI